MEFNILRNILVKEEAETDPRFGCDPEKRRIQDHIRTGVVNLDKLSGPTSHQVSSWVKSILQLKKAGHSGTLDPKVTGVLPVALEDGTKIIHSLLSAGKEYVVVMTLHADISPKKINKTLEYFQARIYQKPPLKSAVKRQVRERTIYYINPLEIADNRNVLFKVGCEAGTYIRKLCHDIGLVLGVGAHMQDLRRTRVGPFDENTLVTLHDLKDAYEFYREDKDERELRRCIQPMERAIEHLRKIWVKDTAVSAIAHGANLHAPGVCKLEEDIKKNDPVAILSLKNELVAVGVSLHTSREILQLKRGVIAGLERVIMAPELYPRKWGKIIS